MNLPNLPTDSLYKFMAICGMTFFFVFYISIFILFQYKSPEGKNAEAEIAAIDSALIFINNKCDKLDSTIPTLCKKYGFEKCADGLIVKIDSLTHFNNQAIFYSYVDSLEKKRVLLLENKEELIIKKAKENTFLTYDEDNAEMTDSFYSYLLLFVSALSIMMAIIGFFN